MQNKNIQPEHSIYSVQTIILFQIFAIKQEKMMR